jgi:hypothetical protein
MKDIIRRGLGVLGEAFTARFYPAPRRSGARPRRAVPAAVELLELRVMLDANGVPPSAVISSAPPVTSAAESAEAINITLTDSDGINPGTITPDNITVTSVATGDQLTVTSAGLNPPDGTGTTDVASYDVAAPDAGGFFSSADNGTYSVVLSLNQIYDPDGDEAASISGSFVVNIAPSGELPPTATITPPPTVATGLASVNVAVTYNAIAGNGDLIDVSTINTGNITVTGPNGTLPVSAVSISPTSDAGTVTANYTVAAPAGVFVTANDGTHTITLNPNQPVLDTNGIAAVSATASSTFAVELPSVLVATISTPANVTVAQPTESISIGFTDPSGINLATISTSNIVVEEEGKTNPTPLTVTGVTVSPSTGNPLQATATYTVAAPSGNFSLTNNGTYAVTFQSNQVEDIDSVFAVTTSSSFAVVVPGAFSLVPSLGSLKLPASLATNTPLKLSVPVTVRNTGTVASFGTSSITLFVSTTQGLTGATQVAAISDGLHLKPNKATTVKIKLAILPASLAAGSYFLVAEVTDVHDNSETAVSNSAVALAPGFIDLTGSLGSVPSVLKPGKKTAATVTVINDGNIPAAGTLQVEFLARPVGTTGSADVPLATPSTRINLASHATKRLRFSIVVPATLTAGTSYVLVAVLNPNSILDDSNIANNTLVGTAAFTVE